MILEIMLLCFLIISALAILRLLINWENIIYLVSSLRRKKYESKI